MTWGFPFSIGSLDVVIDQRSVILESKLSVIANWRLDDIFAFDLLLGIAKACEVAVFQNLGGSWSFLRVELQHSDHQLNGFMRSPGLEPLIQRLMLDVSHLLNHGGRIVSIE